MVPIPRSWKVAALGAVIWFTPISSWAAPQHIPTNLYPSGTKITQISPLSNQQMDCDWGFDCRDGQAQTNAPVFHVRTQDYLHRLAGWAQFGDSKGKAGRLHFAVFASQYLDGAARGVPWNVRAFADFRGTLLVGSFDDVPLERVPRMNPSGAIGNVSEQIARSRAGDVIAMACWTGTVEVEGMAVYTHGSSSQRAVAVRYLTRQMRAAVGGILLGATARKAG